MAKYIDKVAYAKLRGRLTRAEKSSDPVAKIVAALAAFDFLDAGDYVYPDDWHRICRLGDDGVMAIQYGGTLDMDDEQYDVAIEAGQRWHNDRRHW